ncbi:unnamed protein product [Symbiodinium sp. CCMP2592]|nr:unnamed protein product [Symbiodinium sp. CCMP2592]
MDGTGELLCRKCNEPTTVSTSHATGRNELLRICQECGGTERILNKQITQDRSGEEFGSEKAKEGELNAHDEDLLNKCQTAADLKKQLGKMTKEEQYEWYRSEKKSHRQDGGGGGVSKKRTFATAVGVVEDTRRASMRNSEQDRWWLEKDWVAREMTLGLVKNYEDGRAKFLKRCQDDDTESKQLRGVWMLKEFGGLLGELAQEHSVAGTLRQRMDVTDQSELAVCQEQTAQRLKKAGERLATEKAMLDQGMENASVPGLHVARDLDQLKQEEALQDQRWMETVLEKQQADKERLENKDKKKPVRAVLFLQIKNAQAREETMLASAHGKQQEAFTGLREETQAMMAEEDEGTKKEFQSTMDALEEDLSKLLQSIPELAAKRKIKEEEMATTEDDDELLNYLKEATEACKKGPGEWPQLKAVKDRMKAFRTLVNDAKKALAKKDSLAKKKAKNKALAAATSANGTSSQAAADIAISPEMLDCVCWMRKELLKERWSKFQRGSNGLWFNLQEDMLDQMPGKGPVLIPAEQITGLLKSVHDLVYCQSQKQWLGEKMKTDGRGVTTAVIGREAAAKQVLGFIGKSLPVAVADRLSLPGDEELLDLWRPMFCQCMGGSVDTSTAFSLPELTVHLEGTSVFFAGFRATQETQLADLKALTSQEFLDRCEWFANLSAGQGIVLPPGMVYIMIHTEYDVEKDGSPESIPAHMLKLFVLTASSCKWASTSLAKVVARTPELGAKRTGKLLNHFLSVLD